MATKPKAKAKGPVKAAPKAAAKAKPKVIAKPVAKKAPAKVVKLPAKPQPKAAAKSVGQKATSQPAPAKSARKEDDEGYMLASTNAVSFLHTRRQAMFALARKYHLDADDLQQEAFEVLLTCLRDFNPTFKREDGTSHTVQFNTFFGSRLEGKALEQRNRNPEYQARQAHLADMTDDQKAEFRSNPPLLVQHLDQETNMQETLVAEVSTAKRREQGSAGAKLIAEGFVEKKLNELIAQERDEKRRAALLHVKVGGVASFEEIAYHFGVTDSRASQILNELMDAFYVQRLLAGDLRSVQYDFHKLKFQHKRTIRLLSDALANSTPERAGEIRALFTGDYPEVASMSGPQAGSPSLSAPAASMGFNAVFKDPFTPEENARYPLRGLEWRPTAELHALPVNFRGAPDMTEPAHITALMGQEPDAWPLIVTSKGEVLDGARRLTAAQLRGKDKMLCLVRDNLDTATAMTLRVALNLRQIRPDKMDLYWAICALADQGLSQQKIAAAIGTSRTNVIVYTKVKDKATAKLRALFEDGFIQITNASMGVDLPAGQQDALADYIRTQGPGWGKGTQFTEAFEAVAAGKLDALAKQNPAQLSALAPVPTPSQSYAHAPQLEAETNISPALRQRAVVLEQALKDAETWASQREATITKQTQEIADLNAKMDALQRELSTHDLLQSADTQTRQQILKEIKGFFEVIERLASAAHHIDKASRQLRGQPLTHRQQLELSQQTESLEQKINALRVEVLNRKR